jgi:hypothetical protein
MGSDDGASSPGRTAAGSEWQLIRRLAVAHAVLYPVLVAVFAAIKATTTRFGEPPSWPEIFYGPAIMLGCNFSLLCIGVRIECWLRG